MAGTTFLFNNTIQRIFSDTINLSTDTFYCLLTSAASVPAATGSTRADVVASELVGGNYVRKDLVKTPGDPSLFNTNGSKISFTNPQWIALWATPSVTLGGLVILKGTVSASAAGDFVVGYYALPSDYAVPTTLTGAPTITFPFDSTRVISAN